MFDKFIKENWVYVPYTRNDKKWFNSTSKIQSHLEENLNSRQVITQIVKSPMRDFELSQALRKTSSYITNNNLPLFSALIYSDRCPISLNSFENVDIWPSNLISGKEIYKKSVSLEMTYFSSVNKEDIKFIYDCLNKTRFKKI